MKSFYHPFSAAQEVLCETLTVDSCLECLVLADLHTALDLKDAAVKFVVSHSTEFVDQVNLWRKNTWTCNGLSYCRWTSSRPTPS